jgi:hypothetical protein
VGVAGIECVVVVFVVFVAVFVKWSVGSGCAGLFGANLPPPSEGA